MLGLFLAEAALLSLAGGVLGLLLMGLLLGLHLALPCLPLSLAPGFLLLATAIGLLAGIAPARRAAALHPVDALRSE